MNILKTPSLITTLIYSICFIGYIEAKESKLTLSDNWQFVRKSDQVSTWKLKAHPQTIAVFQSNNITEEINWEQIDPDTFFQKTKEHKQQMLDMIGISEWEATNYQWHKKNNHFELAIQGSYKNSSKEMVFFSELHLFSKKITHQILIASSNKNQMNKEDIQHFFSRVTQYLITSSRVTALRANSKFINIKVTQYLITSSRVTGFLNTSFFDTIQAAVLNNTNKILSACIPTAYAFNPNCKNCTPKTNELADVQNVCEILINSPPCNTLPKNKRARCSHTQIQNTQALQSDNMWDYVGSCTTGVSNSVRKVLEFTWNFMKSVWNNITGTEKSTSVRSKLSEYINNIRLYLHIEFEKRYDRTRKGFGRALSAIRAVGGTIGQMTFGTVFNALSSGIKRFRCSNRKAKVESFCEFVSDAFMMSTNYISVLSHGEKILTAKQIVDLHGMFDKVNQSLQAQNNISTEHFKTIESAEHALNRYLSKPQKKALTQVTRLRRGTATRRLRREGFSRREIATLFRKRIVRVL